VYLTFQAAAQYIDQTTFNYLHDGHAGYSAHDQKDLEKMASLSACHVHTVVPRQVEPWFSKSLFSVEQVGLVITIPWLCALAAAWWIPKLADSTGKSRIIAAVTLIVASAGIAGSSVAVSPFVAMIALSFATAGIVAIQPVFWTFPTGYLSGTAVAGGIAFVNSVGTLGGFVAPTIKTWLEKELSSSSAGMMFLAVSAILAALFIYIMKKKRSVNG
jgi:nitrate/nitrite transporter NarK